MRLSLSVAFTVLLAGPAAAQPPDLKFKLPKSGGATRFEAVADVKATITPANARPGEVVTVELTIAPKPDCYTYPANNTTGQVGTNDIVIPPAGDLIFVDDAVTDPAEGLQTRPSKLDPNVTEKYYPHPATPTWRLTAVVSPKAKPGSKSISLVGTTLQVCDKGGCFTSKAPVVDFTVVEGEPAAVPVKYIDKVSRALNPPPPRGVPPERAMPAGPPKSADPVTPVGPQQPDSNPIHADKTHPGLVRKAPVPTEEYRAAMTSLAAKVEQTTVSVQGGLFGLLLAAAFWGLISLATPCVFPMIPITVSLFLKQGNQSTAAAVRLAAVYCLTIVVVLGVSAISLLSVFQELSNHPYMNLFLAALFIVFALSLFGMYDITLPGGLLRFTEKRRGAGGLVGTVFGAIAFSIVSFTCVAPFLGGFAGMTASGQFNKVELALAGVTFAAAFASPFFVLALFPSLLKKLPKSGGWLDSVKVVMGFLELAAALKFLRSAELLLAGRPTYFTYDLVLGAWVAIAVVTGLYLLNVFRLPHDEEKPNIGVVRMLLGVAFIGLAVYLTPALFKAGNGQSQRPSGITYAWVDAFLLPEPGESGGDELPWSADLPGAVDRITREKQSSGTATKPLIFLDITGVNCSNCKLNEKNVFPQPRVRELLQRYTLVQLYADVVPPEVYSAAPPTAERKAEADINLEFQDQVFGNVQRPLYVILEPQTTGKVRVVGVYDEGAINNVDAFVEFLKKPLEGK